MMISHSYFKSNFWFFTIHRSLLNSASLPPRTSLIEGGPRGLAVPWVIWPGSKIRDKWNTEWFRLNQFSFSDGNLFFWYFPPRVHTPILLDSPFAYQERDTITGTPAAAAQLCLVALGLFSWLQFQLAVSTMIYLLPALRKWGMNHMPLFNATITV